MSTISEEQLRTIFNATIVERDDIVQWHEKIKTYEGCLAVLEEL